MYHYNYKITNTGEFYIGVRSCKCSIEEDSYMGSSSIWNKIYVKEHKDKLKKEILEVSPTRKLANGGEVKLLKSVSDNPLCINKYFDYTPDMTGVKQAPEWIEKRKLFGERNGKHHSEKAKKEISSKLKGRIVSEETRKKIGDYHRGKTYGKDTREKISKARQKLRHIINMKTREEWNISITDFIKMFPDENLKESSMRSAVKYKKPYKGYLKITNLK